MIQIVQLSTSLDELADLFYGPLDGSGNLVNILRLDNGLQIVLQDLCEVVYGKSVPIQSNSMCRQQTYSEVRNHGSIARSPPSPAGHHIYPGSV